MGSEVLHFPKPPHQNSLERVEHYPPSEPFFELKLTRHGHMVVEHVVLSNVHIGRMSDSEGRELRSIEREKSRSSEGEGVGSADHHHFITLRVIIGLHGTQI